MKKKSVLKKKIKTRQSSFAGMLVTGFILCMIMVVLCAVQASVPYTIRQESITLLGKEEIIKIKKSGTKTQKADYVILMEKEDAMSSMAMELIEPVLGQMKIGYDVYSIDRFSNRILSKYEYLILSVTHYQLMADYLGDVKDWVRQGGKLLILYPPEESGSFCALSDILGIRDCSGNALVSGVRSLNDFLIGGNGREYPITDAYESSLALTVQDDCAIYLESTDPYPVPLIFRRSCERGQIVFDNFGIMEKSYRGIHAAAVSLLGDSFAYPVINAATFYIDDFPSPVPEGDGIYIKRDFNLSVSDFYSQVWWNDVYGLGKRYGIPYTGLVIEAYSDQVKGVFEANEDTERYSYFGNMLLKSGGEIGIHGYNHMPLVTENFDYEDLFDEYIPWTTRSDMKKSMDEVLRFTKTLFPEEELKVYVPPSNILSCEGRQVLSESGIAAIASVYLAGDLAYEQEFEVSKEDGIVNTPRIISGYLFHDYVNLTALSELNFHLVSTHFQHPDDVLDEDRGAKLGWKEMYRRLAAYMSWLYSACPDIRNLTGSELAAAVQRYDVLTVERTMSESGMRLDFEHFYDEAYVLLRLNEGQTILNMTGGTFHRVADHLYLLDCTSSQVEVIFH